MQWCGGNFVFSRSEAKAQRRNDSEDARNWQKEVSRDVSFLIMGVNWQQMTLYGFKKAMNAI